MNSKSFKSGSDFNQ
uniref:Uncharacterized protein n=1 Tax=Rhizophora mucronata TaxID=61149 RepID=A0A2P2PFI0_RHIMU